MRFTLEITRQETLSTDFKSCHKHRKDNNNLHDTRVINKNTGWDKRWHHFCTPYNFTKY